MSLTPLDIDQKITTTTRTTITLTCQQILEMVNERITDSIPITKDMCIRVTQSNYDGSEYEFNHEPVITIF